METSEMNGDYPKNLNEYSSTEEPRTSIAQFEFASTLKRPHSPATTTTNTSNDSQSSFEESTPVAPTKRQKYDNKLWDFNYVYSPREIRRLRTDLLESRNHVKTLQDRVQHMHNVRKEMEILFDTETKDLRRQQDTDRQAINELENKVQSLRAKEAELLNELNEIKSQHTILKITKDEEIEELERSICKAKEDSSLIDAEERKEISELKQNVKRLEVELESAKEDAETQRKIVETFEAQMQTKRDLEQDFDKTKQALQTANLKIKDLEYAKDNFLEYQQQAKMQTQKLAHYSEMERDIRQLKDENNRLKDAVRNKLILEEEVNNLKHKLTNFKEQEKKLARLQVEQNEKNLQINEWRTVAHEICETNGPDAVLPHLLRSVYERLQQQEINLTSAKIELESKLNAAFYETKITKTELEQRNRLLSEIQRSSEQKQVLIHRLQKKLKLVCRERDSYRGQLDSYEKDLTMCISTNQTSSQVQTLKDRLENMQSTIDGYKDLIVQLENDLQNAQPNLYEEGTSSNMERIIKLENENQQLKVSNDMLLKRKDTLEQQLESYSIEQPNKQDSQIVHLNKNPVTEHLAEQSKVNEKLSQEVDHLRRKIKNLEDGLEASRLNESVCPQSVKTLKDQLKVNEAQMQKMKDLFKSSMQEFRNVVYMMLGYRIDRTPNSLYKLTNMYADSPEDQLCFRLNSEGVLNLLENQYSITLDDLITLHLKHQNSIPVFLSALTVELFNNKTVV